MIPRPQEVQVPLSFVGDAAVLICLLLISFVSGFLAARARPLLFHAQWNALCTTFLQPKQPIPRFEILGQGTGRLDKAVSS
jgi:hypothetical protein